MEGREPPGLRGVVRVAGGGWRPVRPYQGDEAGPLGVEWGEPSGNRLARGAALGGEYVDCVRLAGEGRERGDGSCVGWDHGRPVRGAVHLLAVWFRGGAR